MKFLIINGPNLNLLGMREPDIYGRETYRDLENLVRETARQENLQITLFQSNHEGVLIETIQCAPQAFAGIIYNPAAHTHYSIALRDAIASIPLPVVEVHLSDISRREGFRSVSVIEEVCIGQCRGRHVDSYKDALDMIVAHIDKKSE